MFSEHFKASLRTLRVWWVRQGSRHTQLESDGTWCTNGNAYNVVELELRQRVGKLLQEINPGISACYRCEAPWTFVQHHSTDLGAGQGCFPLCEKCWRELNHSDYRRPYYRRLFESWIADGCTDMTWERVDESLRREDVCGFIVQPDAP